MYETYKRLCKIFESNFTKVQGAGGNISIKKDNLMIIKSSGKTFCQTEKKDISYIDISKYKIGKKRVNYLISGNRESMETNFHMYFSNSIVIHLHDLNILLITLINKTEEYVSFLKSQCSLSLKFAIVPYAHPGKELANQISKFSDKDSDFVILESHGCIFTSNDDSNIEKLIKSIDKYTIKFLKNLEINPIKDDFKISLDIFKIAIDKIKKNDIYFPDQAVFLNESSINEIACHFNNKENIDSIINNYLENSIYELFKSICAIISSANSKYKLNTLNMKNVRKLNDDPIEKRRKNLIN